MSLQSNDATQSQPAKPSARDLMLQLSNRMPLGVRGEPLVQEFLRIFQSHTTPPPQVHHLPDYCYSIFDKLRVTMFGAIPAFNEIVFCPDPSKLASVKTHEEAKQFVRIDWYQFGKVIGVLLRGVRFYEFEIENQVKQDGMLDLKPEDEATVKQLLGTGWLEQKGVQISTAPEGQLTVNLIQALVAKNTPDQTQQHIWNEVALEWGTDAAADFNRGCADGLKGFMDSPGEFPGETTRTSNYIFFLLIWPEINEMLERNPLPDRTEVFEWLKPYHDAGLVCFPNIEHFRDFCETTPIKFARKTPKKT